MANGKTNAMRILEQVSIHYRAYTYESEGGFIDGVTAARKLNQPEQKVFKTLVTQGASRAYYVIIIPVAQELDLKAAAAAVSEKSLSMIRPAELQQVTGYVRGGCSPLGMKKAYPTVLDASALTLDSVLVSAGKIGVQLELRPNELIRATACSVANLVQGGLAQPE